MSEFLAEQNRQLPSIPAQTASPDMPTRNQIKKVFSYFPAVPEAWLSQMLSYMESNPPLIPASQILGLSLTGAKLATPVTTSETTTSATYTNLATTGPEITGLPHGLYVVIFSALISTSATTKAAYANVAGNSSDPGDDTEAIGLDITGGSLSFTGFLTRQLNSDSNTLRMRYRVVGGATGTFANRRMLAIRVSN